MKKIFALIMILVLAVFATACSSSDPVATTAPETTSDTVTTSSTINVDYENALTLRNQLNLGILKLEDNPDLAVTPEQATQLIGLWQGLTALTKSGTGATVEVDAMLSQIENTLTAEQRQAIVDMHFVQEDIQTIAQEWGLSFGNGTTDAGGTGNPGQGAGKNMSDADRAAREAERAANGGSPSGGGGVSTALYERLIQLLEDRAS